MIEGMEQVLNNPETEGESALVFRHEGFGSFDGSTISG
jgi:hypothetical protein